MEASQRQGTLQVTPHLLLTIVVACLGSLQYGYHMGELNAPEDYITCQVELDPNYVETFLRRLGLAQCVPLTDTQYGLVTSVFTIGGLLGSFFAGSFADKYGRKTVSYWNCLAGVAGSTILFASNGYFGMLMGRLLAGVSCGSLIVVTPLFINEMSPLHLKGSLGSMNQVSINCGILLTQSLAIFWANTLQWRFILLFGAAISILNFVLLFKINESPKWLVSKGNLVDAEDVLSQLRGTSRQESRQEIDTWLNGSSSISRNFALPDEEQNRADPLILERPSSTRSALRDSESISLYEYWSDPKYMLPRRAITTILMAQQFCGINSIIFYGVKVIKKTLPNYAIQINFLISTINVLVTFFSSPLVDHWGRKPLLTISSSAMSVCSFLICLGILNNYSGLLVSSVIFYIIAFACGLGPIPFLIISELSHPETVGVAQSYGTTMNWIATFVVGYGFPILNSLIDGYVFLLFATVAVIFALYVRMNVPETKGKVDYSDIWKLIDPHEAYIQ